MTEPKTLSDFANFAQLKPNEVIVSMLHYKDIVMVATSQNIYAVKDGHLALMEFET